MSYRFICICVGLLFGNISYSQPTPVALRMEISHAEICESYSDVMKITLNIRNVGEDTVFLSENLLYESLGISVAGTKNCKVFGSYFYIEGAALDVNLIDTNDHYLGNIYFTDRDTCYYLLNTNSYPKMVKSVHSIEGVVHETYIKLAPNLTYCLNGVVTTSEHERRKVSSINSVSRQEMKVSIVYELKWLAPNGNMNKSLFKTESSTALKEQFLRYYSGEIIKAKY